MIACEKMYYSYENINEAMRMIRGIDWTVKRKAEHFSKACELKGVYDYAMEHIHPILFNPDLCVLGEYFKAAYEHKSFTGKELESLKNQSKNYLERELHDIVRGMELGEYGVM